MRRKIYRVRTNSDLCNDPRWINTPMGGAMGSSNYNYGKINYCDRCKLGTGSFPVVWTPSGRWQYSMGGTDYCQCCNNLYEGDYGRRGRNSNSPNRPSQDVVKKTGDGRRFRNILKINRNIYNL